MKTIYELLETIFADASLNIIFSDHSLWTLDDFINRLNWSRLEICKKPAPEILSLSLPELKATTSTPTAVIKLLIEIFFRGKYSDDDYFTIESDAEPVSEVLHGLEFATYVLQAGAPAEDIVAGLLHDIGRFYYAPDHANRHHHTDGYELMTKLFGQQVGEFCLLHGYAKALLYDAIPGYPDGMSSVSAKTLVLQRNDFTAVHAYLDKLGERREQQYAILKAMFLRVFDDASKYPLEPQFNLITEPMVCELLVRVAAQQHLALEAMC